MKNSLQTLFLTTAALGLLTLAYLLFNPHRQEPHPADVALETLRSHTNLGVSLDEYSELLVDYQTALRVHGRSLGGRSEHHAEQLRLYTLAGSYWACSLEVEELQPTCVEPFYLEAKQEFPDSVDTLKQSDPEIEASCKTEADPDTCEGTRLIKIESMIRFIWGVLAHRN